MQMHEHVLSFLIENQDSGEVYIDIAQSMSIVNRKLYRQQGLWHVHGACTYADVNVPGAPSIGVPYTVAISGAPRTWVTRNALVKAFEKWKDQQKLAYDATSPSVKPKWQDFKVWLNDNHRLNGSLIPTSGHMFGGDDPYTAGEWVHSKIVWEEVGAGGTISKREPELHIVGPNNGDTSAGLIVNYGDSRALVQSPDPVTPGAIADNLYSNSEDAIDDQVQNIMENIKVDNDEPPYDQVTYPGGSNNGNEPLLYSFAANSNTGKRKLALNGFAAPNGLLEIQFSKDSSGGEANTGEFWIQLFVSHREAY